MLLLRRGFQRRIKMSGFLGLLFLIDLRGFFHLGKAGAKNTGDVHPFKPLFVCLSRRFLRFFKCRSRFRCFGFLYFRFLNNRRGLSAMKNSGRFHACFSSLFLLKLCGNRAGGFGILEKAALMMFRARSAACSVPAFWLRFGFPARLLLVFSVFGQRFARQNHGTRGKSRWIDGVFRRRPGSRR